MSAIEISASPIFTEPPDPRGLGGLIVLFQRREVPLPLRSVRVRASICGPFCRTVIEQRFDNDMDVAMEATHIFPLPPDGAVVEMELRAGETVVRAECRQREAAEQAFAEARRAGHRAAMLSAERADVHTLRVTNLPPKTSVTVRIVVVEQLEAADGRMRWRFPTVIAPRYMPGGAKGHSGPGVAADTDVVPDASRISPPLRLSGGVPLDLEVELEGPIRALESALHALRLDLGSTVRVAPSAKATLNKDFILSFSTAEDAQVAARAWTDGKHTALLFEGPALASPPAVPRDAVFVVDISGSMDGGKMEAAKRALMTALHGLMPGDRFRLIAFDDRLEHFRPDFVTYDDASLKAADAWIGRLYARGGTEMLPAISAALDGATPAGRMRTVLFITDGQAGDEERLAAAVANRRQAGRLFTLGIDTAVNAKLLQQLARLGGGTCELCTPTDDIEAVVAKLEARFGSPLLEGILVSGMIAARPEPQALFSGRPVGILLEGTAPVIEVRAYSHAGAQSWTLSAARTGSDLGALWGRARIGYLEDRLALKPFEEEAIKPEILRIALAHNLVSRFTSLIAVDRSVTTTGAPVEVVQPVELPEGWSQGFLGASGGAGGGGMPTPLGAPMPTGGARQRSAPMRKMAAPPAPSGPPPGVVSRAAPGGPVPVAAPASYAAPLAPPPPPAEAMDLLSADDADESYTSGAMPEMEESNAPAPVVDAEKMKDASSTAFFALPKSAARLSAPPPPPSAPPQPQKGLLGRLRDMFMGGEAAEASKIMPPEPVMAEPAPMEPPVSRSSLDHAKREESAEEVAVDNSRQDAKPPAKPKPAPVTLDDSAIARSQGADGSISGDVGRSAAALALLVVRGNTRRQGLRSRTVQKLAAWLSSQTDPRALLAMQILAQAEQSGAATPDLAWAPLFASGAEGAALRAACGM